MKTILVTGGTGDLGSHIVQQLLAKGGYRVRIASRKPRPTGRADVEWAQLDLKTGIGVEQALQGVYTLVHCATDVVNPSNDIAATKNLLQAAKAAGVQHIVYISIVGIDEIPFYFYRAKQGVEAVIKESGVPYSILRTPQFYLLVDKTMTVLAKLPVMLVPKGFIHQPIPTAAVAARMVELVEAGAMGRVPDIAGPCLHSFAEMAQLWLNVRGKRKPIIEVPLPGKTAAGWRAGHNTVPQNPVEGQTLEAWLRERYQRV